MQDLDSNNALKPHRRLRLTTPDRKNAICDTVDALDDVGTHILPMRCCINIKNGELGYVSVLPIRMVQASSVQLHITPGDRIEKSDEIAHFEFGGSNIVILFQAGVVMYISWAPNQKYLVCKVLRHASPKLGDKATSLPLTRLSSSQLFSRIPYRGYLLSLIMAFKMVTPRPLASLATAVVNIFQGSCLGCRMDSKDVATLACMLRCSGFCQQRTRCFRKREPKSCRLMTLKCEL